MEKQMFPTNFLLVLVTLWLHLSNFAFKASEDDATQSPTTCLNCSKCEYPCQQQPSPPLAYGAPPPPSSYGYSIYAAPPPPKEKNPSKCPPPPPPASGECCTPQVPYTLAPPNPYIPVPYDQGQRSASMLLLSKPVNSHE
ncbi:unnamed protein product [Sphenostylis stenocarpa]|uniref:Uncharacterized protein n=1 Tax=Sphenostylis stenocarpa TaxID=92480 RepID=A0AA86VPL9_9FABA|nr:unnamed protein product [Sphenostylis stenocarpa]